MNGGGIYAVSARETITICSYRGESQVVSPRRLTTISNLLKTRNVRRVTPWDDGGL